MNSLALNWIGISGWHLFEVLALVVIVGWAFDILIRAFRVDGDGGR